MIGSVSAEKSVDTKMARLIKPLSRFICSASIRIIDPAGTAVLRTVSPL